MISLKWFAPWRWESFRQWLWYCHKSHYLLIIGFLGFNLRLGRPLYHTFSISVGIEL
jgi:hypothetical protein